MPSPAKCSDTAFFWLSWLSASTSSARRNSLSITGLVNRSGWMSVSLTARIPSAHHMFSTSASTVLVPDGTFCFSTPTMVPVSLPGWLAAVADTATSTRSPRICATMPEKVGLSFRLMAKLASVRAIGSRLS